MSPDRIYQDSSSRQIARQGANARPVVQVGVLSITSPRRARTECGASVQYALANRRPHLEVIERDLGNAELGVEPGPELLRAQVRRALAGDEQVGLGAGSTV